ncbi:MAG: 6-pyruvoyl-tetrahydropterin synthase-related protein [candidate division WOR-3 bacterium]|nr:6-pyruvoyl-tetrahydropterin synthase-related protein [candidate division WOR-3 bacterium]
MAPDGPYAGSRRTPGLSAGIADVIPFVLLAIGTAISCYVFVAPGHPLTVDAWPHLSRTKIVYEALRDGHSPFWSFMFYSGYPALRFYSPLFYFAGGVLALATRGDILLALRILLVSLQMLSVCAMFLLLWRRVRDVQAAALGSLVYVFVPWRAHLLGGYAHYPQAMIYVWLPLMFFFLDRLMARRDRRDALMLGLVVVLSLLSHIIYAAAAVVFLCLVLLLGFPRSTRERGTRAPVAQLVLSALAALALSAFFLIPLLAEYRSHAFLQPSLSVAAPDLRAVLGFLPRLQGRYGGYLGLSVLTLLLLAIVTVGSGTRRRYALSVTLCLVISSLYVFVLPSLGAVGSALALNLPPERFLVFFLFFAALLIGSAWSAWKAQVGLLRRFSLLAFIVLVEVIAVDCTGWNLLDYNYPKQRFLAARPGVYSLIAAEDHSKILDLTVLRDKVDDFMRTESYPAMGFMFGNLPTPLGPFYHQFAPRSMLYCYPWINAAAADLGDTTSRGVATRTRKALALMGVSHVLMYPKSLQCPPPGDSSCPSLLTKDGFRWDSRFVVPGERPYLVFGATGFGMVLASNRIRPVPAERVVQQRTLRIADDWQALLDSVSVNDTLSELSYIPVTTRDRFDSLPGRPGLSVAATSIRDQDVTVRLTASCDCFLRLAVSYYPELRVTVDENVVQFRETKDHFIYLRCPEGTHTVRVTAPLTPVRRWTFAVSALAAVLLILGLALPERRKGQPAS